MLTFSRLRAYLENLSRKTQKNAELRSEVSGYSEVLADETIREGVHPEQARWAAPIELVSILIIVLTTAISTTAAQATDVEPKRTVVVVELFTSEGCSTCPPADALLHDLEQQQPVAGAEVVPLEEHVDYWDHEGWRDPYDSLAWSQRQMAYKQLFKMKEAYTPQMVVDGQAQFVGGNGQEAMLAIDRAAHLVHTIVKITSEKPERPGLARFTVSVEKLAGNTAGDLAEVWLAVTEDGLHSSVTRGENAGHVLQHIATLRSLHKIGIANASESPVSFAGNPNVKIESAWNREHLHAIVFVQEKRSGKIFGAASMKFSQ
jgi:hypothetical protein